MRRALIALLLLGPLCACHPDNQAQFLFVSSTDVWNFNGQPALCITTPHYQIYTTIKESGTQAGDALAHIPPLMEAALRRYQELVPSVVVSDKRMDCYLFRTRAEWDQFTKETAGVDAAIYLKIHKGGYAQDDRYVAYYIGPYETASVAAHEGWHQFISRYFKKRPPPFLEEGIACMFEGVTWRVDEPDWDLSVNHIRAAQLHRAIDAKKLFSLSDLITIHAGQVVQQSGERIEAFYAQSWAFARFMWDAEDGRYRQCMLNWLKDCAAGVDLGFGPHWNPSYARPIVEHYLGMSLAQVDERYQVYLKRIGTAEAAWGDYQLWH